MGVLSTQQSLTGREAAERSRTSERLRCQWVSSCPCASVVWLQTVCFPLGPLTVIWLFFLTRNQFLAWVLTYSVISKGVLFIFVDWMSWRFFKYLPLSSCKMMTYSRIVYLNKVFKETTLSLESQERLGVIKSVCGFVLKADSFCSESAWTGGQVCKTGWKLNL